MKSIASIEEEEIFKDIKFNRDEIRGTDETFFNDGNDKNNLELSLDLNNSENSISSDKLDLCDNSMEEEMDKVKLNDNIKKNKNIITKHRISKRDLNTIPLPIFDCPYCANEEIVFNHLICEKLSLKYLYNTEKKDIHLINILQNNNVLSIENNININTKNQLKKNKIDSIKLEILIHIILDNTEYINKYYKINEALNYLKQKRKRQNYNINIAVKKKIEKEFKNLNFDGKRYGNQKEKLFEDDSNNNIDNYEKMNKYNEFAIENENKNIINNILDKSLEDKICDSFNRLLDDEESFIDLNRKIKWEDIKFEDNPYNIWDPNSIDDEIFDLKK